MISIIVVESPWHFVNLIWTFIFPNCYVLSLSAFGHP